MRARRSTAALAAGAALVAGLLAAAPSQAAPDGDDLVIGEAYLNGGSSGATYLNKFVEIQNPTDRPIDVSGWSVQYRSYSSTAAFTGVVPLGDHHVEPGGTLLVSGNSNAANGQALPTPDVTSSIAFSGNANGGTLALVRSTTALSGDRATVLASDALVDLVGYGASATYEGTGPAASGYSVTSSLQRSASRDTDDNAADLRGGTPTPQACGTACDGAGTPVEPPAAATIAEIQGTGTASPLVGRSVTTTGVVTAAYPTGGFDGVYLQTEGTGGDASARTASDGVFVHSAALAGDVRVGDHLKVTGTVEESFGLTQLDVAAGGWTRLDTAAQAVKPTEVTFPMDDAQREALEGMLVAPQGRFTLTDNFGTNTFGEIGLASGDTGLPQPTDVARPGTDEYRAVVAENARRLVTVDDGAGVNYTAGAKNTPVPWLRPDNEVRTGAPVTFDGDPLVLDYRFSKWRLQPTQQLTAGGDEPITIGSTRQAAPKDVGGDVKIASFNVLNYFTLTGEAYERSGLGTCTYYTDRNGNRVTVNRCSGTGPRGAADDANLQRQQAKIVNAIDGLGADVVSLEEIENSAAFGLDRDTALRTLVAALNEKAGREEWAAVASPTRVPAQEDVIRTAFIHKVGVVEPVGESVIDDDPAFDNARDPLAQEFRPVGGKAADDFVVVVNHFKSKGSGDGEDADTGDGQGASNASRVKQAQALVTFADEQKQAAGTDTVFLTGDFNSYSKEDPVTVLEDAGYVNVPARYTDKTTYQFGGLLGSLDHVFASPAAAAKVTGADVWDINADESLAREYSRYDNNVTRLYDTSPYRASDHDPAVVGFTAKAKEPQVGPTRIAVTGYTAPPRVTLTATVTGGDVKADGGLLVVLDGWRPVGAATVRDGQATVRLAGVGKGRRVLTLAYTGDRRLRPAVTLYRTR
ncbi:5'-nucleotidase [Aeromicrobium sp. SORGH_AS981]|uniref:ExeM/NucH family extracellular endonuclease n=1 Tax=Aeromicrobium sp. SORGH_AS_0981 TaxID=3041802 RepID=UPI0028603905|nr:ExeM/NucH family extracellular endonuclease [Aeromicrobium sp. SORGH_AS_0981]MDR6118752.1 5'-nucleotidase [Aeromicrobium sp. SORGH_AS_0981]